MIGITIHLDGDECWPDLTGKKIVHLGNDSTFSIALVREGMASGRDSVTMRFDLPDDRVLLVETSLALLENVVRALVVAPR